MKKIFKSVFIASSLFLAAIAHADTAPKGSELIKDPQAAYKTVDGKVTVQQFLWNKCIHCYRLEPYVDKWDQEKADYIEFERVPVAWSESHVVDGSFYNYAKVLKKTGKVNNQQLTEINNELFKLALDDRKELNSENVWPIFKDYGIKSASDLDAQVNSFVVASEKSKSKNLTKAYNIAGVPVFVVAGKYLVSFATIEEATPDNLLSTINRIAKEEHDSTIKQSESDSKLPITTPSVEKVQESPVSK
jgi:thiol:disulfide interchange protein DsbA